MRISWREKTNLPLSEFFKQPIVAQSTFDPKFLRKIMYLKGRNKGGM